MRGKLDDDSKSAYDDVQLVASKARFWTRKDSHFMHPMPSCLRRKSLRCDWRGRIILPVPPTIQSISFLLDHPLEVPAAESSQLLPTAGIKLHWTRSDM